jgi:hypothetical protein
MTGCLLLVVIREEFTAVHYRIANVHYLKRYALIVWVHSPASPLCLSETYRYIWRPGDLWFTLHGKRYSWCWDHLDVVTHTKLLCLESFCLFEFVARWKIHLVSDTIQQTRSRQREAPCLRYVALTYSMVQSPSWEANWFAASQEILHI